MQECNLSNFILHVTVRSFDTSNYLCMGSVRHIKELTEVSEETTALSDRHGEY